MSTLHEKICDIVTYYARDKVAVTMRPATMGDLLRYLTLTKHIWDKDDTLEIADEKGQLYTIMLRTEAAGISIVLRRSEK